MSDTVKAAVPAVCPGCGKSFRVPANLVGRTVKCKCGRSWKLDAADATHSDRANVTHGGTTRVDATAADRTRPDPIRQKLTMRGAGKAAQPTALVGDGDLEVGAHVGNFEVLRVLGRGSLGAVYEARDRVLARKVALKVLPAALPADQLPEFLRRANLTNVLMHPNILAIFQVGRSGERCYFVEELGDSGSAADFVAQRGRMMPADAVRVAACAARGLAAAHGRGVVHRNVHPNNILLGEGWTVRIADFGVTDALTGMGVIAADAAPAEFASPEFCMGQPTDARSDVYSVGAVLFFLLTGRTPYSGRTRAAMMAGHTDGVVPDPRTIAEDVPDAVAGIVQKTMAKNPAQRYATAAELAADLEAVHAEVAPEAAAAPAVAEAQTGDVSGASPVTAARSAPLPVKKPAWMSPLYLGGGALAAALLVIGAIFLFRGGSNEPAAKPPAGPDIGQKVLERLVPSDGIGAAAAKQLLGTAAKEHSKGIDSALGEGGAGIGGVRKFVAGLNPGVGLCPVCGELSRPDLSVEHGGRKGAVCSQKCSAAFQRDPAKYSAKLGG